MNPVLVGVGVFVCALGGALFGMWARSRLPDDHFSEGTKDTVKLGIGLVATMTALVLGLITASAKNSFDAVDGAIKQAAVQLLTLDRTLARYGPETREIRTAMKQAVGRKIDSVWARDPSSATGFDPAGSAAGMEALLDSIGALKPGNEEQRRLQARARDISEALLSERWLAVSDESSSISLVFLVILAFWQFGPDCLQCHDGADRMSNFDHASFFPLDGRHAERECEQCHQKKKFVGTISECMKCHAEPEIHAGFFGVQCQYCHTSLAWTPATLRQHTFPLNHGNQGEVACQVCHPARYTELTCYG